MHARLWPVARAGAAGCRLAPPLTPPHRPFALSHQAHVGPICKTFFLGATNDCRWPKLQLYAKPLKPWGGPLLTWQFIP